jgi:hypothetical protein
MKEERMSILTDGTGVSSFTVPKVVKDLIVDALMGAAAALAAVNFTSVDQAVAQPAVATVAIANAVISAVYRFVLKLASA